MEDLKISLVADGNNVSLFGINCTTQFLDGGIIRIIPDKQNTDMKWIDREIEYPICDRILCWENGDVYIADFLESKWGNSYVSTDYNHNEYGGGHNWTHWMPLPTLKITKPTPDCLSGRCALYEREKDEI